MPEALSGLLSGGGGGGSAGSDPLTGIIKMLGGGGASGAGGMQMAPWMKYLLLALGGSGILSNFLRNRSIGSEYNFLNQQQRALTGMSPQALAGKVASATQPLSHGLEQSVGNEVQAMMAERGLSQAPGIFSANMAQAFAPYYQQNQNTALNLILRQMGIPVEYAGALGGFTQQPSSMMPLILALLSQQKKAPGITDPSSVGALPTSGWSDLPDWMSNPATSSSGSSAGSYSGAS